MTSNVSARPAQINVALEDFDALTYRPLACALLHAAKKAGLIACADPKGPAQASHMLAKHLKCHLEQIPAWVALARRACLFVQAGNIEARPRSPLVPAAADARMSVRRRRKSTASRGFDAAHLHRALGHTSVDVALRSFMIRPAPAFFARIFTDRTQEKHLYWLAKRWHMTLCIADDSQAQALYGYLIEPAEQKNYQREQQRLIEGRRLRVKERYELAGSPKEPMHNGAVSALPAPLPFLIPNAWDTADAAMLRRWQQLPSRPRWQHRDNSLLGLKWVQSGQATGLAAVASLFLLPERKLESKRFHQACARHRVVARLADLKLAEARPSAVQYPVQFFPTDQKMQAVLAAADASYAQHTVAKYNLEPGARAGLLWNATLGKDCVPKTS